MSRLLLLMIKLNPTSPPPPPESDEKYIVLIFENGLAMKEQMILEDILGEIGRTNNLVNFPAKLLFEEANIRLVNYNKATKQKQEKVGEEPGPGPGPGSGGLRGISDPGEFRNMLESQEELLALL